MILRWLTSFSCLFLLLAGSCEGATVAGNISLVDSREPAVRAGKDFAGVVIWLEPTNPSALSLVSRTQPRAQILQKDKKFLPHILAVATGTTVDFPNTDPIFHNAFSNFEGKVFDIGLYPPRTSRAVTFDRSGIVRVFCNIHPTMSAIIVVVGTHYFTTTRSDGRFTLANVPPGEYTMRLFHERATPATLDSLTRRISVREGPTAIPPITISESGYLPFPHKNKYGKEYPPAVDDSFYPGAKK